MLAHAPAEIGPTTFSRCIGGVPIAGKPKNIAGKLFGKLKAIEMTDKRDRNGCVIWRCVCTCTKATSVEVASKSLIALEITSCGCNHGQGYSQWPEFHIWQMLKDRCLNRNSQGFYLYGAIGVKVYPEWIGDFMAFYHHIGPRPSSKYSIDRYPNPYGNYEPGNVRWATRDQQSRNLRTNRNYTVNGITKCLLDHCVDAGLSYNTVDGRLKRGIPIEEALTLPPQISAEVLAQPETRKRQHRAITSWWANLSEEERKERMEVVRSHRRV